MSNEKLINAARWVAENTRNSESNSLLLQMAAALEQSEKDKKAARRDALEEAVNRIGAKSCYYNVGSSNFSVCCEMMRAIRAMIEEGEDG